MLGRDVVQFGEMLAYPQRRQDATQLVHVGIERESRHVAPLEHDPAARDGGEPGDRVEDPPGPREPHERAV